MAGDKHQFILGLVIRKMREEGAIIYLVDGSYPGLLGETIPLPPTILRHRPDALGVKKDSRICIGEAKTENDIATSRTYEQIYDFATVELNGQSCEVFVGIPRSAETSFNRGLNRIFISERDNIHILCIPEELFDE